LAVITDATDSSESSRTAPTCQEGREESVSQGAAAVHLSLGEWGSQRRPGHG